METYSWMRRRNQRGIIEDAIESSELKRRHRRGVPPLVEDQDCASSKLLKRESFKCWPSPTGTGDQGIGKNDSEPKVSGNG